MPRMQSLDLEKSDRSPGTVEKQSRVLEISSPLAPQQPSRLQRSVFTATMAGLVIFGVGCLVPGNTTSLFVSPAKSTICKSLHSSAINRSPFYYHVNSHGSNTPEDSALCEGMYAPSRAISHSGHIGLQDDSAETPKRSFFW